MISSNMLPIYSHGSHLEQHLGSPNLRGVYCETGLSPCLLMFNVADMKRDAKCQIVCKTRIFTQRINNEGDKDRSQGDMFFLNSL